MIDGELAVEYGANLRFDLIRRDVGEKSEPTPIDANHRNLRCREIACNAEQAAVAADDDQQVTISEGLARDADTPATAPQSVSNDIKAAFAKNARLATDSTMLRLPLTREETNTLKEFMRPAMRSVNSVYTSLLRGNAVLVVWVQLDRLEHPFTLR
jgi:hypothetical protein